MDCFPDYYTAQLVRKAKRGIALQAKRIQVASELISTNVNSSWQGKGVNTHLTACLDVLVDLAIGVVRSLRAVDMQTGILTFDGIVSTILVNSATHGCERTEYSTFVSEFGDRVLGKVLGSGKSRARVDKFNCDRVLAECYFRWQSLVDANVFERVLVGSVGWKSAERYYGSLGLVSSRFDGMFDFYPVVLRSDAVHVAFFRYLISKSRFSTQIVSLVNSPVVELNASNLTVIVDRQGSRDSVQSIAHDSLINTPLVIFGHLVDSFLAAFGAGLFAQISNDLLNAISEPGTVFLKTMFASEPQTCSSEGHESIKKFLCQTLLSSVRAIHSSDSFGDGLAFLIRADMVAGRCETFTVLGLLLTRAIRFAINEAKPGVSNWWRKPTLHKEWLEVLLDADVGAKKLFVSPSIRFTILTNRKEVKAIYRQLAAGSSCSVQECLGWEGRLGDMLAGWDVSRDVQLLRTTANGLGFVPVPLPPLDQSVSILKGRKSEATLSPIPSSPKEDNMGELFERLMAGQEAILAELFKIRMRLDSVAEDAKVDNLLKETVNLLRFVLDMFSKSVPNPAANFRREVLLIFDRWTRTDHGGFLRTLKALVAVLEDIDLVNSVPLTRNSVAFNSEVKRLSLARLDEKYDGLTVQLEQCLISMEKTLDHVQLKSDHFASHYMGNIHTAMLELVEHRRGIFKAFSQKSVSFSKDFDLISFWLIIVAETSEEYIPNQAQMFGVPGSLAEIRFDEGENIQLV